MIVALLFLVVIISNIDRAAMAFAIDAISFEIDLAQDEVGIILGAFGLGYAITTLLGGVAVDAFGARFVMFIAMLVMVAAMSMAALATSATTLILSQGLLGLAAGPLFPALTRAIADWLSPHERGTALAYSLVALPIALAVSGPLLTVIMALAGWRPMFWALAIGIGLWIPVWMLFFRDDPQRSPFVSQSELEHIGRDRASHRFVGVLAPGRHDWLFVLTNRTLLANAWAFFVFGYFLFFFLTWLPTYLRAAHGLSLDQVGLFSILPWLCAAVLLWVFGLLSDFLLRRTGRLRIARSLLIGSTQAVAALAVLPIVLASDIYWTIGLISVAVGFSLAANTAFYATVIDIASRRAGAALGVMYTAFALAGAIAPYLTGRIVAMTGRFDGAFWLLAALSLSSVIIVMVFHQPDDTLHRARHR
ncbi:sugar phosphate permease [Rhodoligotrophos appendicifer]|uniref:MFS transporter n=1 Tax=Rhodoligotrophos appendicifer TaxID=987056 RepID=UPI001960EEC4|nr:MFS transporter [Rhodoligotrophos appendicifer]